MTPANRLHELQAATPGAVWLPVRHERYQWTATIGDATVIAEYVELLHEWALECGVIRAAGETAADAVVDFKRESARVAALAQALLAALAPENP